MTSPSQLELKMLHIFCRIVSDHSDLISWPGPSALCYITGGPCLRLDTLICTNYEFR